MAVAIISSNIGLLVILSAVSVYAFYPLFLFSILSLLSSFIFLPTIFGRFAELSTVPKVTPWVELFKKNWLNFWAVSLVLGAPHLMLIVLLPRTAGSQQILIASMDSVILLLGIYIYPYVFLKRLRLESIVLGWKFLISNLRRSSALIVITLCIGVGEALSSAWITPRFENNVPLLTGCAYVLNTVFFFLQLLVFNVACMMIDGQHDSSP